MKLEDLLNKKTSPTNDAPTQHTSKGLKETVQDREEGTLDLKLPDYLVNDPEVVGYPSAEMQQLIYNWVAEDLPMGGIYSIKDLGAGRGDFYGHLVFRRPLATSPIPTYTGFEAKDSLVLAGKQKYENLNLIQQDYLTSDLVTDYTICIGTLNEDHGQDKWEVFNKTLNHAINTTKRAIIFVLASNMDSMEGFLDYPFSELFQNVPDNTRFTVDYTRLQDIYKLTVHIGGYN